MVNPFNWADSPKFNHFLCDATPKQSTASPRQYAQMEHSFVIDEAEQRLHNPVDINVSPDQLPCSTPKELKLKKEKRCETFFLNRKPSPVPRRKSLPLLPPSPIAGDLSNDPSFRDTEMVSNRSLMESNRSMMDLSIASTKYDMGASNDSWMVTGTSFLATEQQDCEMEHGCSESSRRAAVTPQVDKSKAIISSPAPVVLWSGSRGRGNESDSVSKIKQRLEWDWSPIKKNRSSFTRRRDPKEMFKKRKAVKRVKARRVARSFLGNWILTSEVITRNVTASEK